ncbi:MAG: hypothetical protein U0930_22165 [Pirellulales bacterium]
MITFACIVAFLLPQQIPESNNELRKICLERIRTLHEVRDFERAEVVAILAQKLFPNDIRITTLLERIQNARNPFRRFEPKELAKFDIIQIEAGGMVEMQLIPKKTSR